MKAILVAVLAATLTTVEAQPAWAQTTDSTQVVFVVQSIRSRVNANTERNEVQRAAFEGSKVAGAVVALQSGLVLGTTDDSGSVVASVPVGRQQLTVRAKDYQPLTCRVNIRAPAGDTVRIQLIPERRVQVWETAPACRQRR